MPANPDIKNLRQAIGTQKEVADKLGISERFLRYRESGDLDAPAWLEYAIKWLNLKKKDK